MEQNRTNPIEEILGQAMGKIKTMIDVNTIVGDPIANTQGAIILPISKVSLGFVAGGGEYTNGTKKPKKLRAYPFAGGSGGGVTLTPMGFLAIIDGTPNFIRVENRTGWDKLGDLLPELIKKYATEAKNDDKKSKN